MISSPGNRKDEKGNNIILAGVSSRKGKGKKRKGLLELEKVVNVLWGERKGDCPR